MRDKSCLSEAVCLVHLCKVYQFDSFDNIICCFDFIHPIMMFCLIFFSNALSVLCRSPGLGLRRPYGQMKADGWKKSASSWSAVSSTKCRYPPHTPTMVAPSLHHKPCLILHSDLLADHDKTLRLSRADIVDWQQHLFLACCDELPWQQHRHKTSLSK